MNAILLYRLPSLGAAALLAALAWTPALADDTFYAADADDAAIRLAVPAPAQDEAHALGPHPAIVVQRLHAAAGYDYAAKFYPHPAGLRLFLHPPHEGPQTVATSDDAQPAAPHRRPAPGRLRTRVAESSEPGSARRAR